MSSPIVYIQKSVPIKHIETVGDCKEVVDSLIKRAKVFMDHGTEKEKAYLQTTYEDMVLFRDAVLAKDRDDHRKANVDAHDLEDKFKLIGLVINYVEWGFCK
jgi:hypothetical protein